MADVTVQLGYKDQAWFDANPTLVLEEGQPVHLGQTGTYKIGDGSTQLSALVFLGNAGAPAFANITGSPSDNPALDAALDAKLDASAYVQHFKGVFATLVALQTAYPTALAGDYAQVDPGSGTNLQTYSYDLQDGWVKSSTDGSGANNTDQLPEGSTNLYFTAARVRAVLLSGLSLATNTVISATDTILEALGKLQAQITSIPSAVMTFTNKSGNVSQWTNDSGYLIASDVTNSKKGSFGVDFSNSRQVLLVGQTALIVMPYSGTITGWQIYESSDPPISGNAVVDVRKDTYANYPPTAGDSIAGSEKPTLSAAIKNQDLTLTTWTTAVNAGDNIVLTIESVTSCKNLKVVVFINKS